MYNSDDQGWRPSTQMIESWVWYVYVCGRGRDRRRDRQADPRRLLANSQAGRARFGFSERVYLKI